jgi:hypothetical protein
MQALLWLVQGLEAKARELLVTGLRKAMPAEPLSAACVALAEHAVDADLRMLSAPTSPPLRGSCATCCR